MFIARLIQQQQDGHHQSNSNSASSSRSSPQYKQFILLFTRLSSSTLHEDKRVAIKEMQTLTQKHPDIPIDYEHVQQLMRIVDDMQRQDTEISRLALQCILNLLQKPNQQNNSSAAASTTSSNSAATSGTAYPPAAPHAHNSNISLFTHHPALITQLISFLSSSTDFHTRFHAIQILTLLLLEKRDKVQAILLQQGGAMMNTMIELLSDPNDSIRNESLLLIEALCYQHTDIQKMVAFNGGFDLLLKCVDKDGGIVESGVIGEDCLRIVMSMCRNNTSNQQLFIELGASKSLIHLLQSFTSTLTPTIATTTPAAAGTTATTTEQLTPESMNTLAFALDVIYYISEVTNSLSALSSLLPILLTLSLSAKLSVSIRYMSLSLIAVLIDSNKHNQHNFSTLTVPPRSTSVLVWLLSAVLDPLHTQPLQASLSLFILRCYFYHNKDAQLQTVFSFAPAPTPPRSTHAPQQPQQYQQHYHHHQHQQHQPPVHNENVHSPLGAILLHAFAQTVTRRVATQCMMYLLRGNRDCQVMLLKMPVMSNTDNLNQSPHSDGTWTDRFIEAIHQTFMLPSLTNTSTPQTVAEADTSAAVASVPNSTEVALLCFLCEWLDGCAEVAELLFSRPSFLQQMITLATTHIDPYIKGLATYAFLICLELLRTDSNNTTSSSIRTHQYLLPQHHPHTAHSNNFLASANLLSLIQHSITLDLFKHNLSFLRQSPPFLALHSITSHRQLHPYFTMIQRKVQTRAEQGDMSAEHTFLLDDDGAVSDLDAPSLLIDQLFVKRYMTLYDQMNDRLLSLFMSSAASDSSSSSAPAAPPAHSASSNSLSSKTVSWDEYHRLKQDNLRLQADNETLHLSLQALQQQHQQLLQEPRQQHTSSLLPPLAPSLHNTADDQQQRNDLIQQQQQEILSLQRTIVQLQQEVSAMHTVIANNNNNNAAIGSLLPSSSRAASSPSVAFAELQAKYDELLSEHEDLLILLASYDDEAQNKANTDSQTQSNADNSNNSIDSSPLSQNLNSTPSPDAVLTTVSTSRDLQMGERKEAKRDFAVPSYQSKATQLQQEPAPAKGSSTQQNGYPVRTQAKPTTLTVPSAPTATGAATTTSYPAASPQTGTASIPPPTTEPSQLGRLSPQLQSTESKPTAIPWGPPPPLPSATGLARPNVPLFQPRFIPPPAAVTTGSQSMPRIQHPSQFAQPPPKDVTRRYPATTDLP